MKKLEQIDIINSKASLTFLNQAQRRAEVRPGSS